MAKSCTIRLTRRALSLPLFLSLGRNEASAANPCCRLARTNLTKDVSLNPLCCGFDRSSGGFEERVAS